MKLLSKSVLALFLCLSLTNCSDDDGGDDGGSGDFSPPKIQNAKPGKGNILVVGDSLANGFGSTAAGRPPAVCLGEVFQSPVFNRAEDGTTSDEILNVLNSNLSIVAPKLIFISAGGNDAIYDYYGPISYPVNKSLNAMSQMFDQALSSGAVVAYLAINPPYEGSERLPQITALARRKGVVVIDGMAGVWENAAMMTDEIHPNDEGYNIMCQRIQAGLSPYYP